MQLPSYSCVLCNQDCDETLAHLLLDCPFSMQCWGSINIQVQQNSDPFQVLQTFRDQLGVPFFMEIIILMAWAIWKARNDLIFNQVNPTLQQTIRYFNEEMQLLLLRAKRSYSPQIELWIANQV